MGNEIVDEKIWFVESEEFSATGEGAKALVQIQKIHPPHGNRTFTICKIIQQINESIVVKGLTLRFDQINQSIPSINFDNDDEIRDFVSRKVRREFKSKISIKELESEKVLVALYFLKLQGDLCGNFIRALKPSKYDNELFGWIEYSDRAVWKDSVIQIYPQ